MIGGIPSKILWCRFEAYGDVLQALAEAFVVKSRFPDIKLGFLTREKYAEVAKAQPYIDEVICGEKHPFSVLLRTAAIVRGKKYDWIGSTMRGGHFSILALAGGAKHRLSDTTYLSAIDTCNVHKWAETAGIDLFSRTSRTLFPSGAAESFAKEILKPLAGKKRIFCVVGASLERKMWPAEQWIDFLTPLVSNSWTAVLNAYGTVEKTLADKIEAALPNGTALNLANKLNFSTITGVISECQIAVGSDTGPMHAALLCGLPGICISDHKISRDVGYNMPWLTLITTEKDFMPLSVISAETVRTAFDMLVKKYNL